MKAVIVLALCLSVALAQLSVSGSVRNNFPYDLQLVSSQLTSGTKFL